MLIKYSIDRENRVIEEKWMGTIDEDDLADYWKCYLEDPEVLDIRRTLVDLREAQILFTGYQMEALIASIVCTASP